MSAFRSPVARPAGSVDPIVRSGSDSTPHSARSAGSAAATRADDRNSLSERILRELHGLYRDPSSLRDGKRSDFGRTGLVRMSMETCMDPVLLPPRRRITVLIIGNHSAGKSSFINYYIEEKVQATGIAVETKGFTILRHGVERQDVRGDGALLDNEHIAAVAERISPADRRAFIDSLSLVVRTSTAKDFANIDFIDSPGLLDGGVKYPFDVNRVILEMASVADLILVFLDPKGQALVSRTMDVVMALNESGYHEKMRYYLTQADTIAQRADLNKVLVQVAQNLSQRVRYTQGLEIPCIWIPHAGERDNGLMSHGETLSPDSNSMPKLLAEIHDSIGFNVQSNMAKCINDCKRVIDFIDAEVLADEARAVIKGRLSRYQWYLLPLLFTLAVTSFLDVFLEVEEYLPTQARQAEAVQSLLTYARPGISFLKTAADGVGIFGLPQRLLVLVVAFLVLTIVVQLFRCRSRYVRTRSSSEIAVLRAYQSNAEVMRKHVMELYHLYVRSAQTPDFQSPSAAATRAATPAAAAR